MVIITVAFMAVSFVMGLGTPSTGLFEKAFLLALIVGCLYAAAKVATLSQRLVHRLEARGGR
jgi:hypothetical protein